MKRLWTILAFLLMTSPAWADDPTAYHIPSKTVFKATDGTYHSLSGVIDTTQVGKTVAGLDTNGKVTAPVVGDVSNAIADAVNAVHISDMLASIKTDESNIAQNLASIKALQANIINANSDITAEVSRASSAEASIQSALTAEINRAKAAEATFITAAGGVFTGTVSTKGSDLIAGGGGSLIVTGGAGAMRSVLYQTDGKNRFVTGLNAATESGSDAGSDFIINALSDDGTTSRTAVMIDRSSLQTSFAVTPSAPTPDSSDSSQSLATTAFVKQLLSNYVPKGGTDGAMTIGGDIISTGTITAKTGMRGGGSGPVLDGKMSTGWYLAYYVLTNGETDFINDPGTNPGSFAWFNRKTADWSKDTTHTPIMSLDGTGLLTPSSLAVTGSAAFSNAQITGGTITNTAFGIGATPNTTFVENKGSFIGTGGAIVSGTIGGLTDAYTDGGVNHIRNMSLYGTTTTPSFDWGFQSDLTTVPAHGSNVAMSLVRQGSDGVGQLQINGTIALNDPTVGQLLMRPAKDGTQSWSLGNATTSLMTIGSDSTSAYVQLNGIMRVNPTNVNLTKDLYTSGNNIRMVQPSGDLSVGIYGATGQRRSLSFGTVPQGSTFYTDRFQFGLDKDAETGSNKGSSLVLNSYSDTGTLLNSVFSVARDSGVLSFTSTPRFPTADGSDNSNLGATTAYVQKGLADLKRDILNNPTGIVSGTLSMGSGDFAGLGLHVTASGEPIVVYTDASGAQQTPALATEAWVNHTISEDRMVQDPATSTCSTQGCAYVTARYAVITNLSTDNSAAITLPSGSSSINGARYTLLNRTGYQVCVYPPGKTDHIENSGAGGCLALAPGQTLTYISSGNGWWHAF